jgi:hypothetical protein
MSDRIAALERDRDRWRTGNEGLVAANKVQIRLREIAETQLKEVQTELAEIKKALRMCG